MTGSRIVDHTARQRFPQPAAAAWRRVSLATSDLERARQALAFIEVLLRTLAGLLLADYLRGLRDPSVDARVERLVRPSLGTWLALVRQLSGYLASRGEPAAFMAEAGLWLRDSRGRATEASKLLDGLVEIRNRLAHGSAAIGGDEAAALAADVLERCRKLIETLGWLPGYRLLRVLSQQPDRDGGARGTVQIYEGSEEVPLPRAASWDAALLGEAVYLAEPSGSSILEVGPLFRIAPSPGTNQEHLFLVAEFKKRRVRLVDESTGAQLDLPPPAGGAPDSVVALLDATRSKRPFQRNDHPSVPFAVSGPLKPLDPGDRYEVLGLLGQGGMARVYRVRDSKRDGEYALKVLLPELSADVVFRERFAREVRALRRCRHPRIVEVVDSGQLPAGSLYLQMPILPGGTLAAKISPEGQTEAQVRGWAKQALEGLAALHDAGLVHRDVKPSNFLLDDDGNLVLADLGIVQWDREGKLTRTLERLGSLAFTAPEQRLGHPVSDRADIYSLALVLHALRTGREAAERPGRKVDGELGALIRWMGASEPADRPSVAQCLASLAGREAPPVARSTTGDDEITAGGTASPRPRWPLVALGVGLAVILGFVAHRMTRGSVGALTPVVLGVDLEGPDNDVVRWTLERTFDPLTYRIQEVVESGPEGRVVLLDGVVGEDAELRWLGVRPTDGGSIDPELREALLLSASSITRVPTLAWTGGFELRVGWLESGSAVTGWSAQDGGPMPELERWSQAARDELAQRALACVPAGFRGMGYAVRIDLALLPVGDGWSSGVRSVRPEYFKTTAALVEEALAGLEDLHGCLETVPVEGLPSELEGRGLLVEVLGWGSEPFEWPSPDNHAWHGNLITLAPQVDYEPMDARVRYASARAQEVLEVVRILDEAEEELQACDEGLLWAAGLWSATGTLHLSFDREGLWIRDWSFRDDPMARVITSDQTHLDRVEPAVIGCVDGVLQRQPWPVLERLILVELSLVQGPPFPSAIRQDAQAHEAAMILAMHLMRAWDQAGRCLLQAAPEATLPEAFYAEVGEDGTLLQFDPWVEGEPHPLLATCVAVATDGIRLPAPGRPVSIDPWGRGVPPQLSEGDERPGSANELISMLNTAGMHRLGKECYEAELRAREEVEHEAFRLDLRLVIEASGRISDIEVGGDDPGYLDLSDCIAEGLGSIRLPPAEEDMELLHGIILSTE